MPKPAERIYAHALAKDMGEKAPEWLRKEAERRHEHSQRLISDIKRTIDSMPSDIKDRACFVLRGSVARMEYDPADERKSDIDLLILTDHDISLAKVNDELAKGLPGHEIEPMILGINSYAGPKMEDHAHDFLAGEHMMGAIVSFLPYEVLHDPKDYGKRFGMVVEQAREENVLRVLGLGDNSLDALVDAMAYHLKTGMRIAKKDHLVDPALFETTVPEKHEARKFHIRKSVQETLDKLIRKGLVRKEGEKYYTTAQKGV
jgi:predicted nucleotidyltransferase